ncbi:hypothetical protein ACH41E_33485 [Streptomyces sp. NPDC020412]|uniref:hypothetical protein n=1 Tax=Streptomyces sp. NPDC020412 TaxID=3365073 RepID=UPI003788C095
MTDNQFFHHAATRWALDAGANPVELVRDWSAGRATPVRIGTAWEVVRITTSVGREALARLRKQQFLVGPVLSIPARATLEVVVPLGTAASWPTLPERYRYVTATAGTMLCPPPRRRPAGGRKWIAAPGSRPPMTDGHLLCEAVAATIASHRHALAIARAEVAE